MSIRATPQRRLILASAVIAFVAMLGMAAAAQAQAVDTRFWVTDGNINATVQSGDTLYLGGNFTYVGPNTGSGTSLSLITGAPVTNSPRVDGQVLAVASDGAGGWYLGGQFTKVGGVARQHLAHLLADQSLDPWDPSPDGAVLAIATSGSRVFVGGTFTTIGGQSRSRIAALDAGSGLATPWAPEADGPVQALVLQGATLYAGGQFTSIGSQPRLRVAALDTTTALASAWAPDANGFVQALAVRDSLVYVGGGFTSIGGQPRVNLAAIDAGTGLAIAWNADVNGFVQALQTDSAAVYVGGGFTTIHSTPRNRLAALDLVTGAPTAWNPDVNNVVQTLTVRGGTVFAGGSFDQVGGQSRRFLAAIDAASGAPSAWQSDANSNVRASAVDGTNLFVGGDLTSVGGVRRSYLAALRLSTGEALAWDPGANNFVNALAYQSGVVYAGGTFTKIGVKSRNSIAAIDAATGIATNWNPSANNTIYALAVSGTKVYVGGGFTNIGGAARNRLAVLDVTTSLPTTWNPNANNIVYTLAVTSSAVYTGGQFTFVGGQVRSNIAALNLTNGQAMSWSPAIDGAVQSIAASSGVVYVGGGFTQVGPANRNNLAAIDRNTGIATAWNPGPDNFVQSIALAGGVLYAGGDFTHVGGAARSYLAAMDAATGSVLGWDPEPNNFIQAVAVAGPRVFAGGFFTNAGGTGVTGLMAVPTSAAPVPPTVSLLVPNGGETWAAGSTHDIVWSASGPSGVANVDLLYSTDGGATYPNVIALALPNSGVYHWSIPDIASTQVRMQVVAHDFIGLSSSDASAADFTIRRWAITASAAAGGTIAPAGVTNLLQGDSQAYSITPGAHRHIADVQVDGASVGAIALYTFGNVAADHTIAATFAIDTYTITATAGSDGTIAPVGSVQVPYGATQGYTITPAADHHVADVLVDGASVGAVTTYTFSNVSAAHTIAATFAVDTRVITASAGPDGSITPSGAVTVVKGAAQAFAIAASAAHHIADVLVDGVSVGAVSAYTFTNVTVDHTIAASFAIDATQIAAIAPAFTISPAHPTIEVPIELTGVNPDPVRAFSVSFQLSGGIALATGTSSVSEGGFLSTGGVTTSFQVVDHGAGSYTVDGAILGDGCGQSPSHGTLFTLTLAATAGTSGTGSVAITSSKLRDCTNQMIPFADGPAVNVPYDLLAPPVTLTAPSGGPARVLGAPQTITWTASDAAGIAGIDLVLSTDSGVTYAVTIASALPNTGSYPWNWGPVGAHLRVKVVAHDTNGNVGESASPADFEVVPLTLVTIAGPGGSIAPPGATHPTYGTDVPVTIAPIAGYRVTSVKVDGVEIGPANSYTFVAFITDHTLIATFADSTAPAVHVLLPNGHEGYVIGTTQLVKWTATDNVAVTGVDVLLSRAGAAGPYDTLATALPNTGQYSWDVNGPASTTARIKVVAHDADLNAGSDVSDADFSILSTAGVDDGPVTMFALAPLSPNPLRASGQLRFAVPREAHVHLALVDVQGREVLVLADGIYAAGRHSVPVASSAGLQPGLYFARMLAGGRSFTQRVLVMH